MSVPVEGELKSTMEALLHSRRRPVNESELVRLFPGIPVRAVLAAIDDDLAGRGVMLAKAAGGWCLRSRPEASDLARNFATEPPRLSRAATEVLAVIAAFQSIERVTRSDIERVRGVQLSPGIFDSLLAAGYIKPGPRRETPGRPLTWVTTDRFLESFDVDDAAELPAVRKMKEAGILVLPSAKSEAREADPTDI